MLSYCLKCRKKTESKEESKNPKVTKTKKKQNQCFYQSVQCVIIVKIEIYQRAITNLPILSNIPLVSTNFK